jgi:hypothetical protein
MHNGGHVLCLLHRSGNGGQARHPSHFEHRSHMLEMRGAVEVVVVLACSTLLSNERLEERLGLVGDGFRLQYIGLFVQVPPHVGERSRDSCRVLRRRNLDFILHLDFILLNLVVNVAEEFFRQVLAVVDASIILDEFGFRHALCFQILVVRVGIQHDDGESQDVRRVGISKDGGRIVGDVSFGEFEHESINLLSFSWQTEALEVESNGFGEWKLGKVEHVDERMHDSDIVLVAKKRKRKNPPEL